MVSSGKPRARSLGHSGVSRRLSFHETKNFTCGEGGALIINDEADVARAHVLNDKGTNRKAFFEGQVDKYSWQDMGSSFGLSDILAGYLLGQLEQQERVLDRRRHVFDTYMNPDSLLSRRNSGSRCQWFRTIRCRAITCSFSSCQQRAHAQGFSTGCVSVAFMPPSTTCPCIHRSVDRNSPRDGESYL